MKKFILNLILIVLVLSLGIGGFKFLSQQKKLPVQENKPKPLPLVKVMPVQLTQYQVQFSAQGLVETKDKVNLSSQVQGKIIFVSPHLYPGDTINKEEVLFKIDPSNYQLDLQRAKAILNELKASLTLLQAKAKTSIWSWQLAYGQNTTVPALVAKEPELKQLQAKIEQAKTNLELAQLNLRRTLIQAPCSGRVIERKVNLGQFVNPGQILANFYPFSSLEVKVPLDLNQLAYVHLGSFVLIQGDGFKNISGQVVRFDSRLQPTQLLNVYLKLNASPPHLVPGAMVKVTFWGKKVKGVSFIPRTSLHDLGQVWLVKNSTLQIRKVKVIGQRGQKLAVLGLKQGEKLIVSPLGEVKAGMRVQVME